MMTRNDFELLAVALRSARAEIDEHQYDTFRTAVNAVAEVCKANNARFKKGEFFAACGIDDADDTLLSPERIAAIRQAN